MDIISKISENKLIAYLATLVAIILIAKMVPDTFGQATVVILALFTALLGKNKSPEDNQ